MIVGIIGLGLIGGSMAIDLKRRGFARIVLGVEADPVNAAAAERNLWTRSSRSRSASAGATSL